MKTKLFFEAITKFILGIALVGLLVFLPAGTLSYVWGWVFMGLLFVPMFFAGIVMLKRYPETAKKRGIFTGLVITKKALPSSRI